MPSTAYTVSNVLIHHELKHEKKELTLAGAPVEDTIQTAVGEGRIRRPASILLEGYTLFELAVRILYSALLRRDNPVLSEELAQSYKSSWMGYTYTIYDAWGTCSKAKTLSRMCAKTAVFIQNHHVESEMNGCGGADTCSGECFALLPCFNVEIFCRTEHTACVQYTCACIVTNQGHHCLSRG